MPESTAHKVKSPKSRKIMAGRFVLAGVLLCWQSLALADCITLLHGLARTAEAMEPAREYFEERGYTVANIDYPSRKHPIEALAPLAVEQGLQSCPSGEPVHFVTHSMGGILVRYYLQDHTVDNLGRVVMLAPPNQGSEVIDSLREMPGFEAINGPAGMQLGTDEKSIPAQLGRVNFELGVIAGDYSVNPLLSLSLPNPNDGKVSVDSARVEGMADFLVLSYSHPFIMNSPEVLQQVQHFIEHGSFSREEKSEALDQTGAESAPAVTPPGSATIATPPLPESLPD